MFMGSISYHVNLTLELKDVASLGALGTTYLIFCVIGTRGQ